MNTLSQRRVFRDIVSSLRACLPDTRQLAGGVDSRCLTEPPASFTPEPAEAIGGHASGGALSVSYPETAPSLASNKEPGSRGLFGRAGIEGGRPPCSLRSPSHRITAHESRVVLADLVEAMMRKDRAKTVAAVLSARFTDEELEWLSNQLGRVPHERKRA